MTLINFPNPIKELLLEIVRLFFKSNNVIITFNPIWVPETIIEIKTRFQPQKKTFYKIKLSSTVSSISSTYIEFTIQTIEGPFKKSFTGETLLFGYTPKGLK